MALSLLLAAACGPTSRPAGEDSATGLATPPPWTRLVAHGERDTTCDSDGMVVEVRIQGDNRGGLDAVLLKVRDLAVLANGTPIPVEPRVTVVDLARTEHAWLLGRFTVPAGTDGVELSLRLDDFGGYEQGTSADWFDSRNPPIRVLAPVTHLAQRGHVVLHVDLQRSVVARPGRSTLLLPSLSVQY